MHTTTATPATPAPTTDARRTQQPPELITCRNCGSRHRAILCPLCEEPTPSFIVIRGRVAA